MRYLVYIVLMMSTFLLNGAELFPFKPGGYIVYGKVNIVPETEQAKRGIVEITEGGFTRNLGWNENRGAWLEISVRFRNAAAYKDKLGLHVTLNDKDGFAGEVPGTLKQEGADLRCTALVPVAPDLSNISIWCRGSNGNTTGVDQYIIRERPVPQIDRIPQVPSIRTIQTDDTPFYAQIFFYKYLENSRGAVIERAEENQNFKTLGRIPPGFHSYKDTTVQPGKKYRYRIRNCSNAGESAWSEPAAATIPPWRLSPGKKSYYVDSENGRDTNDGSSPEKAWKTFASVNYLFFAAGDRLKLKCGSRWTEPLKLHGSGSLEAPVQLSPYGKGALPAIAVVDKLYAVRLKNASCWNISGLDLSNLQPVPESVKETKDLFGNKIERGSLFFGPYARHARRIGFLLELENCGIAKNISIQGLNIHDVEGAQNCKENGGIVISVHGGRKPSRFHNLKIRNNTLKNVCRSGIVFVVSPHADRKHWFPSTDVEIAGNRLYDIGGDGIVPWACDGVRVTGNILVRGACTALDANAGIWPWSCDNAVFRGNIAAYTGKFKGNTDGQGYDIDTNNYNTTMEYNLSFMNGGGFMLVCGEADSLNRKVTVRNNVSIYDGIAFMSLWNNLQDVSITHNTFVTRDDEKQWFLISNWGKGEGDPVQMKNINISENLFVMNRKLGFRSTQKSWMIRKNMFAGKFAYEPADGAALYKDNAVSNPEFKGELDLTAEILPQLEKLTVSGTRTGADIPGLIRVLKQNGCFNEKIEPLPFPQN